MPSEKRCVFVPVSVAGRFLRIFAFLNFPFLAFLLVCPAVMSEPSEVAYKREEEAGGGWPRADSVDSTCYPRKQAPYEACKQKSLPCIFPQVEILLFYQLILGRP